MFLDTVESLAVFRALGLRIRGRKVKTICNWSASQAGEMLLIWLNRPACEHTTGVNAYGGTRVTWQTALCKADFPFKICFFFI